LNADIALSPNTERYIIIFQIDFISMEVVTIISDAKGVACCRYWKFHRISQNVIPAIDFTSKIPKSTASSER
jgi:hypothetical protein